MKLGAVFNRLAFRVALILFFTLSAAQAVNFYLFSEKRRNDLIQEASYNAIQRFVEQVIDADNIRLDPPRQDNSGPPPRNRRGKGRFGRLGPPRLPPGGRVNPNGRVFKSSEPLSIPDREGLNPTIKEQLHSALLNSKLKAIEWAASYAPVPEQGHVNRRRSISKPLLKKDNDKRIRPNEIRLSVKLQGSTYWINGIYPVQPLPVQVSLSDFLESASVFVFFLILAIVLIVYSIVRPLNALSKATSKVGQHEDKVVLPIEGPSEVRQMTQSFNEMNERVSELIREKDVLLGALGHDLRTPLTSLRLRIEQMTPVDSRVQAIKTIDETAKLIEDILEFARSVGDREALATYDLTSIIYDIVADYQDMGSHIDLIDTPRIVIPCKPSAIKRMLRDLIENALKYAGNAKISMSTDESRAILLVEDDGPGVDEATMELLLQPFKRGDDSRSRRTGGTGLGLAIAKSVATAHGGDLILMNRPSGGLCVRVLLSL